MKMTIGTAIRTARSMKSMTTYEVADKAHISRGYLTQIENDQRLPTWRALQLLADALGIPMSYLTMMTEADHPVLAPLTAIIYTQMFEGAQRA